LFVKSFQSGKSRYLLAAPRTSRTAINHFDRIERTFGVGGRRRYCVRLGRKRIGLARSVSGRAEGDAKKEEERNKKNVITIIIIIADGGGGGGD